MKPAGAAGPLRVAFVVGSFPELSETFILDMMTGLIDRGCEVQILGRPPADPRGVRHGTVDEYRLLEKVVYWDRPRGAYRQALARTGPLLRESPGSTLAGMARALGELPRGASLFRLWSRATALRSIPRPDVLFAQFGPNGVLAEQARRVAGLRIPVVTDYLGHDLSRLLRRPNPAGYYASLFAHGELQLPLSEYFRDKLIALGCPPERIVVQHIGVDTSRFVFRARSRRAEEPTRFISVSRLVEKKGLETGLRALALVAREVPAVHWDMVGDGPLRPSLEALVRELGIGERVTLHGAKPREQVRPLLEAAHILLAPSVTASDGDQEGTPVAIMEGMAAGMPVVSTLHSGIPEMVRHGVSGMLVPERDPVALAAAMRELALAPERWAELGRQGRAIVEQGYDNRLLGDRLLEILSRVAGKTA